MRTFTNDAQRFEDIDKDVLAKIEAEDAVKYHARTGRWPEGLSVRAWEHVERLISVDK